MPAESSGAPRGTLRIFLVENHADTLKYTKMYLEQMGHAVQSARTIAEALDLIPEVNADVLISDIGLPDGDGWELLEKAGRAAPKYAIAMSGFGMYADRSRSLAVGYRHHLLKPFPPEDLDAILMEAAGELHG